MIYLSILAIHIWFMHIYTIYWSDHHMCGSSLPGPEARRVGIGGYPINMVVHQPLLSLWGLTYRVYIYMVVSWNGGTPQSSILDWDFPWNKPSILVYPPWLWKPHIYIYIYMLHICYIPYYHQPPGGDSQPQRPSQETLSAPSPDSDLRGRGPPCERPWRSNCPNSRRCRWCSQGDRDPPGRKWPLGHFGGGNRLKIMEEIWENHE